MHKANQKQKWHLYCLPNNLNIISVLTSTAVSYIMNSMLLLHKWVFFTQVFQIWKRKKGNQGTYSTVDKHTEKTTILFQEKHSELHKQLNSDFWELCSICDYHPVSAVKLS